MKVIFYGVISIIPVFVLGGWLAAIFHVVPLITFYEEVLKAM